jgi:energy-coupling factor transporter ATP-binding protein EcfA2
MTLNEDLAHWASSRPDWQQEALARFCRNETLSVEDIEAIATQLIEGTYEGGAGIGAEDVPGSTAVGQPVSLSQISNVAGVNALLPDQALSFGRGLTIIFGSNGSGKSGYARLIRAAVTARVKSSRLLGDVYAENESTQQAVISYLVGATPAVWNLGNAQSLDLSRIRFYDEECGDAYVTRASEANYRPSALTILDQLSDACEALAAELYRRLGANEAAKPQLPVLHLGTTASDFVSNLSATTSELEIDAATTLRDDHAAEIAKRLSEEARLRGSDLSQERERLVALSRDWATVAAHALSLAASVEASALDVFKEEQRNLRELREAARVASSRSFEREPLSAVGSVTWRAMWEAARRFAETDAYHGHMFPLTGEDALCVLCQQPLDVQAADRLARFEAFVADTTSRDADAAAQALQLSRDRLAQLQSIPAAVSTAVHRLQLAGEPVQPALEWFETATADAQTALMWLDGGEDVEPRPVVDTVSTAAAARAQELTDQADGIDATTFTRTLSLASSAVLELQDAQALSEARSDVEAEVARLAQRVRIEAVRRLAATNSVTTLRGALTEKYVTQEMRDHFAREAEHLQLSGVTLNRTGRGREAALEHQTALIGIHREADVDEVLSEGEQTALGLAGFLTEVELDGSLSAVVLDDPVCSLDAERRARVADRLVKLAGTRQVIVFTHEITFVHALNREAKRASLDVDVRSIQRMGGVRPGLISDQLPWAAKDVSQRISGLETEVARLKRERASLTDEEYARSIAPLAGRLSETLERAVHLHIVNELVDRGTNEVRPTMLKILPKFSQADHDEFQAAYARTSSWAERHDNAPEENYVPPTLEEFEKELSWLREWHVRVKRYSQ